MARQDETDFVDLLLQSGIIGADIKEILSGY
jgi:hypothetical protein